MSAVLRAVFVNNEHKWTLENLSNFVAYWKDKGLFIIECNLKNDASKRQSWEQSEEFGRPEESKGQRLEKWIWPSVTLLVLVSLSPSCKPEKEGSSLTSNRSGPPCWPETLDGKFYQEYVKW